MGTPPFLGVGGTTPGRPPKSIILFLFSCASPLSPSSPGAGVARCGLVFTVFLQIFFNFV